MNRLWSEMAADHTLGAALILAFALAACALALGASARRRFQRWRATPRLPREPGRRGLWDTARLLGGPFPLSIALHLTVLLILVGVIKQHAAPVLLTIRLEGGGFVPRSALAAPVPPQVATPETAPLDIARPPVVAMRTQNLATDYVRAIDRATLQIGSVGRGTTYGRGVGNSFGGYIGRLRHQGLDVCLVIDGTGSMGDVIDDVKTRMNQLVLAIHRLVPTARLGLVEFGGRGEPIEVHPFTLSPAVMGGYLGMIESQGGGEWQEDTLGGIRAAVEQMVWRPPAKKVIVLVGDTPPFAEDMEKVMDLISRFRAEDGTFNTVDVTVEEHERFQREMFYSVHHRYPKIIPPLQEFYLETQHAYQEMAAAGGGEWRSLTMDMQVNQQVLILAFGQQWESQVAAFGEIGPTAASP
jgi:hypothetical protein